MIRKSFLLVSLTLIVLIFGSCSAFVYKNQARLNPINVNFELEPDPELIHGTLDNGFRYYLYKNLTPENRVNIHLNVLSGSINEKDNQRGLAHYLEHMLFNGSTHFKPGQLVEYFQSIGMDFGSDANAHTGFFETVYDLSLPKGDKKSLEDALIVIDDYAQGALLLDSEIDRERGIILAEKRDRDSVAYRTFKASFNFELPGSKIIERYPIGVTKIINKADKALLKDFYDTWYCPDNMILIMVGDFDESVVEKLIKKRFSGLKARGEKGLLSENTFNFHKGIKTFYHYESEAGNTDITIETVSRVDFEPQTLDSLKKQIKKNIGTSILNNRLSRLLGNKETLFSEIGANSGVLLKNIAFASIWAKTTPGKWKNTLAILDKNLRSALDFGFTQKELNRAKAEYINSLENKVKKSSTRESKYISSSIIYHLNNKKVFQKAETRLKILKPFIQSLEIDDINKSFIAAWDKEHRLVLVTGNSKIGQNKENAEKIILSEYNKSIKTPVNKYQDYNKVEFPYLPEPDEPIGSKGQGKVKTKREIPELDIITIDYTNLVRLNLKKTNFKKGEFLINLAIKGGKVTEPVTKPGLSMVSTNLLNESGLGKVDKEELKEILSGTSVDIGFNVEGDNFSFSGQGEPSELKLVFELIYSYLKDPGFKEESLDLVKSRYEQRFNSLSKTPAGLMHIKGNQFLAGGDNRFGYPSIELINKITIQDVKEWLIPFFKKASLEISIVGDFDIEKAEELTTKYFGTLAKRDNNGLKLLSNNVPKFPESKKLVLSMDTKIKKSEIRLTFLTDDFWDISQTRALNLLARVFSERNRKIIREKLGLAYSAYAYNHPSTVYDNYGILHAVVLANPDETDFVLTNMKEITVLLAKHGVTEKELELVRKPVLSYIKDIQKTNAYWLDSVLSDSLTHPQKFEWAQNISNDYSSISGKTISFLAQKFLDVEKSTIIVIKPAQ
ncbi:MAG: insulinase family protein [Desulfobacterales bacterium]|nr:insulinase family protein [Desulfobacterales bacterium]